MLRFFTLDYDLIDPSFRGHSKCEILFGASNCSFFQIYNDNIELFAIASNIVLALSTIAFNRYYNNDIKRGNLAGSDKEKNNSLIVHQKLFRILVALILFMCLHCTVLHFIVIPKDIFW